MTKITDKAGNAGACCPVRGHWLALESASVARRAGVMSLSQCITERQRVIARAKDAGHHLALLRVAWLPERFACDCHEGGDHE